MFCVCVYSRVCRVKLFHWSLKRARYGRCVCVQDYARRRQRGGRWGHKLEESRWFCRSVRSSVFRLPDHKVGPSSLIPISMAYLS